MRLLLRANSHRALESGSAEVAASPDTPHRERWQWHVRLHERDVAGGGAGASAPAVSGSEPTTGDSTRATAVAERADGSSVWLEASADPAAAEPDAQVLEVSTEQRLHREESDVVVLLTTRGTVLVEGRHRLGELDALVLEGDDPLEVSLEAGSDVPASVAVARLRAVGDRPVGWVP